MIIYSGPFFLYCFLVNHFNPSRPAPASIWSKVPQKIPNMHSLLTAREKNVIKVLNKDYRRRWRHAPAANRNLIYYPGDNPKRRCWSACSGKIPTLRMSGGLMWSVSRSRIMTGKEKLLSLGFPCTEGTARAMGTPLLACKDVKRCGSIAGNAMNFNSVAVIELVALSSFKLAS